MFDSSHNSNPYVLLEEQSRFNEATFFQRESATEYETRFSSGRKSVVLLVVTFAASVVLNLLMGVTLINSRSLSSIVPDTTMDVTSFAELSYNVSKPIRWRTEYSTGTDTERDLLWLSEDYSQHGIIALDDSYAAAQKLHPAVPFFWKNHTGVYVVSAYHQLHCLQIIYRSLKDYRESVPLESHGTSYAHVIHCLDTLRSDIMCAADDTPRYLTAEGSGSGEGQHRMCRDWAQLESWTDQHDGCFKHIRPKDKAIAEIERFKYCKNDSPYIPAVREYFGYPADWQPWPYQEQTEYLLADGTTRKQSES